MYNCQEKSTDSEHKTLPTVDHFIEEEWERLVWSISMITLNEDGKMDQTRRYVNDKLTTEKSHWFGGPHQHDRHGSPDQDNNHRHGLPS